MSTTLTAAPTLPDPSSSIIERTWSEYVEREYWRGEREPHFYLYASSRRRCLRRAVLEATHPEALPAFDSDTKARLLRGNDRERDIETDLARVGRMSEPGFRITGQQETIRIQDRKGRLVIKGKIDGQIHWANHTMWPYEIKNWSPFLTERLHTFDDLYANPWTWSGAHQLLSYLFAKNQPHGLLILDRSGLPRLIDVHLEDHLEHMEGFLADATVCVDHMEADTLPDFIQDAGECRRCPLYGSSCNPPSLTAGAEIIVDESTIQKLERWHATEGAGEEHEALDKELKKKFRGIDLAIAGAFLLEGKWQRDTKYDIPANVKKEIDQLKAPFAQRVDQGKFFLTITKIA